MLQNSSISVSRHSLRQEGHKAIHRKQSPKTRLHKERMQRLPLPTGLPFQNSVEILLNPPCEVQNQVHLRLVRLRHLKVHNIALI
jgi:hypothetical protein